MKTAFTTHLLCVLLCALPANAGWANWWLTPDQQGLRHFQSGEFVDAAKVFEDTMWQGMAWYRAGEFEKAAQAFARRDTAEADFNQGTAWLMNGRYEDAIASFDRALSKRPGWKEAAENRELAAARLKMTDPKGGDMGDQKVGADKIVFDKDAENKGGQDTDMPGTDALSDQEMQALWLRRVQTQPADFLRAKFAFQAAQPEDDN